jgi:hypothetical protein
MSERIEALKKLATKEVWGNNPYNGSPEFEGYELDAEKFAELIVRECMAQCADNGSGDEWDKGVRWAVAQIKQHFGVEE